MRTIKFRGYSQTFNSWFYGDLLITRQTATIVCEESGHEYEVDPNSVGQFTGLYDKNGKEIYEGDINQYGYVIKYCKEKALFGEYSTRNGIDYDILMSYPIDSKSQIIKGNIYENPELLTD